MKILYTNNCLFSATRLGHCPPFPHLESTKFAWHGHNFLLSAYFNAATALSVPLSKNEQYIDPTHLTNDHESQESSTVNHWHKSILLSEENIRLLYKQNLNLLQQKLHCTSLNDLCQTTEPTDYNVLQKLASLPELLPFTEIKLQSTPHTFCYKNKRHTLISYMQKLTCAHFLPQVKKGHKCSNLHGHGFLVQATCYGNERVFDYHHFASQFTTLVDELNQKLLNETPSLQNPTSENLARFIFNKLQKPLPELCSVTIFETPSAASTYYGNELWECYKELEFDAAHTRQNHFYGHRYRIRLTLKGKIDETAGWILDFSDIKELFRPYYLQLDHQLLNSQMTTSNTSNACDTHTCHCHKNSLRTIITGLFSTLKDEIPFLSAIHIQEDENFGISIQKE